MDTLDTPEPLDFGDLGDIFLSQIGETASIIVDPEHGLHAVEVNGSVDVGMLVVLAMQHAARIVERTPYVRDARVVDTFDRLVKAARA